ncbi:hypothetical protein C2G38_2181336 [Gigaspora rosea]|uniref:C2H2-type domain-containing protein n=1 Tax=Gigaspora rosea TaxID=44941 RepID=A0A397VKC0_9GLOM|nr:hypothetical protein C2G38_2181336 [Gigaspora rosea]
MTSRCQHCQEIFFTRKELVIHEKLKHRNNKIIPHRYLLTQPSLKQITFYQDAFINEPSFRYSPVQQKYSCSFQGEASEQRSKQLDSYQVIFGWSQSELKENDRIFQCGTATCKFVADSGKFSEQSAIIPTNLITSQALSSPQVHNIDSSKNSLNNISSSQKL